MKGKISCKTDGVEFVHDSGESVLGHFARTLAFGNSIGTVPTLAIAIVIDFNFNPREEPVIPVLSFHLCPECVKLFSLYFQEVAF